MTLAELVAETQRGAMVTNGAACALIARGVLDEVVAALRAGKKVELRKFGTFYTKVRKPRPARNPRTGKVVMLPRRTAALFRFSPEIRDNLKLAAKPPFELGGLQ